MNQAIQQVLDKTLIDSLSPALKGAVDRLLARGIRKDTLLQLIEAMILKATGGDPNKGNLVRRAVEVYLESK